MNKLIATLVLMAVSLFAQAGGSSSGLVTYPGTSGSVFYFQSSGTITGNPSCNTANRWAADTSTAAGANHQRLVLLAKALGQTVAIYGTGACSVWGDSESIDRVYIAQ